MVQFLFLWQIVTPLFLVMAAGYAVRKLGLLSAAADHSVIQLVVWLLTPCLILDTIIGNDALASPHNWLWPPLCGFASVALGIAVAHVAARFLPASQRVRGTFVFVSSIQNYSFVPLPLCAILFDCGTTGVLFAFVLGVEIALWSIALWQLTRHGDWRKAITAPVVTIFAALVLNFFGAGQWLPVALHRSFHLLGDCAVPIALLVSGALVADFLKVDFLKSDRTATLAALVVRVGLLPIFILLAARFLPVDLALKRVLVLQAAMPAAILPLAITRVSQGDMPTALRVVLSTSLVGFLTIPLWLIAGLHWVLGRP